MEIKCGYGSPLFVFDGLYGAIRRVLRGYKGYCKVEYFGKILSILHWGIAGQN